MTIQFPRGSEWRKWDLHFHTPSSFDYADKSITNEQIIQTLLENEICAVAITDHHVIDIERIRALKKIAANKISIFPGIELRSELGGSECVHYIGIFPEDSDLELIWTKLQGQCSLTPSEIKAKGNEKVYCDLKDTAKIIHSLNGIVTIHAGNKSNSVENIRNAPAYKRAVKGDLVKDAFVNIFEIGSEEDKVDYETIVFPSIKQRLPMIIGSDCHDIKSYSLKQYCWIKADPTFEGLKHAIAEPYRRFCISTIPLKLDIVNKNKNNFIESVKVSKTDSKTAYPWFNCEVKLNTDLVAIIGNKGSGKSALADIIGLAGCTKNDDYFSFLNGERFRKPPLNPSASFTVKMTWCDKSESFKKLSDKIGSAVIERVKYLPQKYIETVCNELGEEFQAEINKMVFSYLPEEDKLGRKNFDTLMEYMCSSVDDESKLLQKQISEINRDIIKLEEMSTQEYSEELHNKLKLKLDEVRTHRLNKPLPVKPPKTDPEKESTLQGIANSITDVEKKILDYQNKLNETTRIISDLNLIRAKISSFSNTFDTLKAEIDKIISINKLDNLDLKLTFSYDITPLEALEESLISLRTAYLTTLEKNTANWSGESLFYQLTNLNQNKKTIESQLSADQQRYQKYLEDLKAWRDKRNHLFGSKESIDSLRNIVHDLRYIKKELKSIVLEKSKIRETFLKKLYSLKLSKVQKYEKVYLPVLEHINELKKEEDDPLNFSVKITLIKEFPDQLLSYVNQAVSSIFKGQKEGRQNLIDIIKKYDLNDEQNLLSFIDEIYAGVTDNISKRSSLVKDRLKFYDYLFGLDYLKVEYKISLGTVPLEQLSPGEKGALLLIFYLVLDKSNCPLIIDQPEDNLDNQSVYKRLVPFIKDSKEKRQIIIVTHNPNLAVACDADQIIYSKMDKQAYSICYESGSIENPIINKHIVDVLEGTMPAFVLRKVKYIE